MYTKMKFMKNIGLVGMMSIVLILASCDRGVKTEAANLASPAELLREWQTGSAAISPEDLADQLINQVPDWVIVDVRPAEAFQQYSLPGAQNIPLSVLFEEAKTDLPQPSKTVVCISNDGSSAEQAWLWFRQKGWTQVRVLTGGLNAWTADILQPAEPEPGADAASWDQYRLRMAVRQYLTGASKALEPESYTPVTQPTVTAKKITPKPKAKVAEEEEGC